MENKKKSLILSIIGLFVILIVVIGATYAYFQSNNGNTTIANINTTSGTVDDLSFLTDEGITLNISEENLQQDGDDVSETSVAKATLIANNTTNEAEATYNVYILIENNEIEYSSYEKEGEIKKFITKEAKEKENLEEYKGIPELVIKVEKNENEYEIKKRLNKTTEGYDITEAEGLYAIAEDEVIRVVGSDTRSTTDEWKITIIFKNLDYNQQLNAGKKFEGKIILTKEKLLNEISTINDLVKLSEEVNKGDSKEGKYYILTKDLDFGNISDYQTGSEALMNELTDKNGKGFTPIGYSNVNAFSGNFDGLNNTIKNIHISNTVADARLGLFGMMSGNSKIEIKNLTITGEITSAVRATIGGIIGENLGCQINIENCVNNVNVTSESNEWLTGGIIGNNNGSGITTIKNCINNGKITNGASTGGLIGRTDGVLTIENSINKGEVTNNLGSYAGGLLGKDSSNTNLTIIKNSHNEGNVEGYIGGNFDNHTGGLMGMSYGIVNITGSSNGINNDSTVKGIDAGGIIGRVAGEISIDNCYNVANIIGKTSDNSWVGGLVGIIQNSKIDTNIVSNSYNTGNVTGSFRTAGIIGLVYDAELIMDKCYNTGNVTSDSFENRITYAGGLIGHAGLNKLTNAKLTVLNSYNLGDVINNTKKTGTSEVSSGLIGVGGDFNNFTVSIINSYNKGNITAKNIASGIINMGGKIYLKNTYNIGTIDAITKYSLAQISSSPDNKIEYNYYLNNANIAGSNLDNVGTSITIDEIKKQNFVNTLNQNIEGIDLKEIDLSLEGYTLSKWKLGSDYPVLDF